MRVENYDENGVNSLSGTIRANTSESGDDLMFERSLGTNFVCAVLKTANLLTDENVQFVKLHEKEFRNSVLQGGYAGGNDQITSVDVISAMKLSAATGKHAMLTEELIMRTLAGHWKLPFLNLDLAKIKPCSAVVKISEAFARKHCLAPISMSQKSLFVAVVSPFEVGVLDTLQKMTPLKIRPVISTKTDIFKAIDACFKPQQTGLPDEDTLEAFHPLPDPASPLGSFEDPALAFDVSPDDDSPRAEKQIVTVVNRLILSAFEHHASEVHLEPKLFHSKVRFRVDGVLHVVKTIPLEVHDKVILRLKALARMDISEKRKPQDGRTQFKFHDRGISLRLSSVPVVFGEKLVIRILDPIMLVRPLEDLGFSPEVLRRYTAVLSNPGGLLLISGPAGSGKTTTLYSTLNVLAGKGMNVTTIEDPVELAYEEFNQIAVQPKLDITFETATRHIIRQAPDVMMIGELRDQKTIADAINAALLGHLVVSTIHAPDAATALVRLINAGIPPALVASTLIAILGQRLVRRVCENCATPYALNSEELEMMQDFYTNRTQLAAQKGTGCPKCRRSGYSGRTAVFELMLISDELRGLIRENADAFRIRNLAISRGMRPLRQQVAVKVREGITTCDEMLRVTGRYSMELGNQET